MNSLHVCVGSESQSVYPEGAMTRAVVPSRCFLSLSRGLIVLIFSTSDVISSTCLIEEPHRGHTRNI